MGTVPFSSSVTAVSDTAPADERFDERDDAVHIERGGVDEDSVRSRLHGRRIALVTQPEIRGQRIGTDVGPLRLTTPRADARVSREVNLDVGARRDDGADVAAFHHRVRLGGALALALAHDRGHPRRLADAGAPP